MSAELHQLRYQLRACRKLAQEFTTRGDAESVRHFQRRAGAVQKAITAREQSTTSNFQPVAGA
jgi:hypothetical protein